MAQILKTQIFHGLFYIHFHFNIVVSLTVCLPSSTNTWQKKMHFVQQRQYLPISVSLSCNQTKQRNTFMDIQLMPLVSKTNLNECCGLLGQPFGALQSRCHRCDTGVTKTRTEVPSPKSQPGTLTTKFLFLLCSRTLWAKCTEILWYPQLARKVAKCHYR